MILKDDLQSVYFKLCAQPCLHSISFLVIVMSINSRHSYTSNAYIDSLLFQEKLQSTASKRISL